MPTTLTPRKRATTARATDSGNASAANLRNLQQHGMHQPLLIGNKYWVLVGSGQNYDVFQINANGSFSQITELSDWKLFNRAVMAQCYPQLFTSRVLTTNQGTINQGNITTPTTRTGRTSTASKVNVTKAQVASS